MRGEILIKDSGRLEEIKKNFKEGGKDNLHIVSDFDRTITYGVDSFGKKTATVIMGLRSDPKYLGEEYQRKAHELFDIYHPIEINPKIPLEEKKKKMHEWWSKHFDLIAGVGLTKEIIQQVVREKPLKFRSGSLEFLSFLNKKKIPLIFMSAAPGDMIDEYLKQDNLRYPNVHVLANRYEFDSEGKAVKIVEPIIHTFNKTEVTLEKSSIYQSIETRKNVILLGDSLGDVGMVEGFDYDNLIKIGFLNENIDENLEHYRNEFDVVITGDGDMNYINELLKEILG